MSILSPFVRGTTDAVHVYFLQAGTRRLVPDQATLNFMLGGQTVRVLSDTDLTAIPQGPALPSRRNGLLLTQRFQVPPPAPVVFFMANGQRRRIPDIETLTGLQSSGSQVIAVEATDLAAIPEGPPLPTRREGTVYGGMGTTFAFVIQAGRKRAVPNATTLRDSGHDVATLLAVTPSDLAFIPDGAPFASTSRFLSPPAADVPLVLLPVRLETRFRNTELWLRIYPDDVHVNSFEPELTDDERRARTSYLAQAGAGVDAARPAFAALARQFGPERAAWIASANVPAASKPSQWTRAPFTNVLPERWVVIGYQANAPGEVLAIGPPIQDSLPVGPAPDGPGPTADDGMRWATDFDRAVQAGMGFKISLTPVQQRGFNRLVVIGLRTTLNAKDSAARLGDLLQAHHYTDGLELLAHNTPTNNTDDVQSGLSTRDPNHDARFALEQGPSLCPSRPTADGDHLARALGIAPAVFSHVRGANGGQDEQARAINTVMWPATWGYYLSQIVAGAVPNPETILPAARDHFAGHVRARGHFPTLRIGRQAYGVLPVTWNVQWQPLEGRALDAPLAGLLRRMRATWESSIANVPRIPGATDPEAALVALLGMTPASNSFVARSVIGPEYSFSYWNFVQRDLPKAWWTVLTQKSLPDAGDLSSIMANTRLANATYIRQHRFLSNVIVAPAPLDGVPAPAFIAQLAGLGWQALRDVPLPAAPVPLLFLLLRHAALREYMDTALELLTAVGVAQPHERIEPELLALAPGPARAPAWDLLQRVLPGRGPVGTFLDGAKNDATLPAFAAFWRSFAQVSRFSAANLDAATREAFDLASHRLDSWITSLAHFRLESTRAAKPAGGIVLGAYGWLENVRPQPQQAPSAGYIHAPSLNQATTAAVLRSGYLTHRNGSQGPLAIDLSSGRVRLALHLLDGIGEGQPLGALLGYRLERALHETGLDSFIDNLRTLAPLETGAAGTDVVDGLVLLRKFHSDPNFWNAPGLPAAGTQARSALTAVITRLDDALDATADLALAESVHQLIRGNLLRAGATLDAIARGDTPPPEIDVVRTPRSGTASTYRLLAVAIGANAPGWTRTPRAQAEPRLNAWAASLLGNPARVRIRARFVDARGGVSPVEIGLDRLALAPVDLLALPETPGISGELADRIRRVVAQARPPSVPAGATIEILPERDPSWKPPAIGLTEWLGLLQAISRLATAARPLEPRDLVAPRNTMGAIDTAELQSRADAAEAQLRAALVSLQGATAGDSALLGAAAFGVHGAVPTLDPATWPSQIAATVTELRARVQKLDNLAAAFTRATAPPDALRDHDIARLKIVFGPSFVVLPVLAATTVAGWAQLWGNTLSLQDGDALASVRWLQRVSRVRQGAARLDTALMFAEAVAGRSLLQLQVAQLPSGPSDRWVALDAPADSTASRLSLVAFSPAAFAAGAAVAGLVVDEWIEVWPSAQEITGLSFHYMDPVARAPQAILLAVRPDDFPEWTMEAVEGSVLEALALAKIRAVDPDSLGALGHYLPALYFAFNAGAPRPETVSTDFNIALQAHP